MKTVVLLPGRIDEITRSDHELRLRCLENLIAATKARIAVLEAKHGYRC